jgi:hypothetical protein
MTYSDASTSMATIPDYYADVPATDPVLFILAGNLLFSPCEARRSRWG